MPERTFSPVSRWVRKAGKDRRSGQASTSMSMHSNAALRSSNPSSILHSACELCFCHTRHPLLSPGNSLPAARDTHRCLKGPRSTMRMRDSSTTVCAYSRGSTPSSCSATSHGLLWAALDSIWTAALRTCLHGSPPEHHCDTGATHARMFGSTRPDSVAGRLARRADVHARQPSKPRVRTCQGRRPGPGSPGWQCAAADRWGAAAAAACF